MCVKATVLTRAVRPEAQWCKRAIRRWPFHKAPRQTRTDPFSHLPKTALKEPIFGVDGIVTVEIRLAVRGLRSTAKRSEWKMRGIRRTQAGKSQDSAPDAAMTMRGSFRT